MDWRSRLRRTRSLSAGPSFFDRFASKEAAPPDKIMSVSQLVARYQTTEKESTSIRDAPVNDGNAKPKQVLKEPAPSLRESKETRRGSLMKRNDTRGRDKSGLTRSKSMGSLQSGARSIGALKALFEAPQSKTSSSSPDKAADVMPAEKGEAKEGKSSAEEPKIQIPPDSTADAAKTHAKGDVTRRVVKPRRVERRKTIGGIDFETIAASQADEKRKSIADFKDSSFNPTKEKLCVSVKAMSALYLSKVAPLDSTRSLSAQVQSAESGKIIKPTKMAEESQPRAGDLPGTPSSSHKPEPVDTSGAHSRPPAPSQLSKEKLRQQRQKCELRRLLKHTHPELKMSDAAVDEELAEVLSSETGEAAGETGYEGEVLSRCLIFENCAPSNKVYPSAPMIHKVMGKVERHDGSKTSAVFEEQEERPRDDGDEGIVEDDTRLGSSPDPKKDGEEDVMRIDVQATKKIFENQYVDMSPLRPDNKFQLCDKYNVHNKNKSNACTKSLDLTNPPNKQGPCVHIVGQDCDPEVSTRETVFENEPTSPLDPEEPEEKIETSAALLQNNPFIPTNIEREHPFMQTSKSQSPAGDSGAAQDYLITNVKDRTHLFESMPFDKIGHQSKDDIETMVENMKETLNTLYHGNCIHSDGSIIEVYETMIAKKAKFTLSEGGPEIGYDEVAEGGAQNFILQLLPRANLKAHITYVKEASEGSMVATVVSVPVRSTTNQDTEFKTANVVQLVEDILNQDNSLQKGMVLQEDGNRCPEVIVYSLYNYFDKEDVKTYCPPQGAEYDEPEPERGEVRNTENKEQRKGLVKSTISCLLESPKDQTYHESIRPESTEKGNVKLFKGCIEKGDLEYLKTLQAEPTEEEQELPPKQNVSGEVIELHHELGGDHAEEDSQWVPVDVKRLRNIFSGDQRPTQPKQNAWESCPKSTTITCAFLQSSTECIHQEVKNSFRQCDGKTQEVAPKGSYLRLETQDDGGVHQANPVVVDDKDGISNLQTAIHSLQQAPIEAKSDFKQTEAELYQNNKPPGNKLPSTSKITVEHKSDNQHETTEGDTNSEEVGTTETRSKVGQRGTEVVQKQPFQAATASVHSPETPAAQQEDEEVVFQGKLQAALDSLEKSNINVSRGDFRAAMIYRNTSKPQKERSENVAAACVEKPTKEEFCHATEPKSSQAPLRQQFSGEQLSAANAEPPRQSENLNKLATSAVAEKIRRPVGPKPAVPPKPEHLKAKPRDARPANTKNPEETQTNPVRPEDTVPQPLAMTSMSHRDEDKRSSFKTNAGADSGPEVADHQRNRLFDEAMHKSEGIEAHGSVVILVSDNDNQNIELQQERNVKAEEKSPQEENMNETDESHVDFNGACKKFGGKKEFSAKITPVKPKRGKIAQLHNKTPKNTSGENSLFLGYVGEEPQHTLTGPSGNDPKTFRQTSDSNETKKIMQASKVEMREKKVRPETEGERRQRLSVHMDEIMRGNATAAMEIADNLRKQEELHSLLSRVEEIERDTSEVDVRSLRGIFENVPDWVVSSDNNKPTEEKQGGRLPLEKHSPESRSSMEHVFGDLERASEEIMTLKEQTLARLVDIEEAIKKALYSVSTLKSDSDIAGLSCLFKESLGNQQGGPLTGGISKISIGSSRIKPSQTRGSAAAPGSTAPPVSQAAKQRASPPSSPAFISIQSAARKTDTSEPFPPETPICPPCQSSPKAEENFRTTKTLMCNSPAQNRKGEPRKGGIKKSDSAPKRELSVLEVQTDREGKSILGSKTVPEIYERNRHLEKGLCSSKTSAFVPGQPEAPTSAGQAAVGPACHQITDQKP
uniref:LIM domain-containing protein isoform X2 n=1 Tax=Gasterosteus aculeatus aculeatus TaxID=481459 RepID=UPI001A97F068|nr:LIM domain-containing protein isoform X2 [Gasterosteus aculeatus aculeatus]